MYFTVKDLLDYPCHYMYESCNHTTGHPKKATRHSIFCCYWNGYLSSYLLLFLFFFSFFYFFVFFFPNQIKGSWKQCSRIYLAGFSPFKKKRKREKRKRREHWLFFCSGKNRVCYVWDEIIRINDSMDATLLYLIWFDLIFYLFWFFFFFAGISVWSRGCSPELAADSLPSCLDYTPVAVHLLFAGRLNGSCFPFTGIGGTAKLFWGTISWLVFFV